MSAPTSAEELRQQIEAERGAHAAIMAQLVEQTRTLNALLTEHKAAFKDLITRVTELRVAKGECMAAHAAGLTPHMSFDTGSDLLDSVLYKLQARLEDPLVSFCSSVLQKLETAALEALTPYGLGHVSALFTSNTTAVRTTGLLVLFHNDVRGVQQWARKHVKCCASCAAQESKLPAWRRHHCSDKKRGFAAAPKMRAIPHKHYHHLCISLIQERSMADRMDTDDRLVILHTTAFVHVQAAQTGQPLEDAATTCADMRNNLQASLEEAMAELCITTRDSAPWNTGTTPNVKLSAAIETFLHMVQLHVQVLPMPHASITSTGAPCTVVKVEVEVDVPLHLSTLALFLQLLEDPEQPRYVIQHVFIPLAQLIGDALGDVHTVSHYAAIGLHFVEALYRIAVHHGLLKTGGSRDEGRSVNSGVSTSLPKAKGVKGNALQQLYLILQALAVFETNFDVEVITPDISVRHAQTTEGTKRTALRLARALLLPFSAPSSPLFASEANSGAANMMIKVSRAPTAFLEILNRAFVSNHRLPSTSRSSALDMFVSPRTKINVGLKLYKELVIDVHRPYHPSTGIVLTAENGVGGRPRAQPCTPVIDLPVDVVVANIRVAEYVAQLLQKLDKLESSAAFSEEGQHEKKGKALLQGVASSLQQRAPVKRFCGQWSAAKIKVVEVPKVCVDVLLPFDATEVELRSATRPLLFLRLSYNS